MGRGGAVGGRRPPRRRARGADEAARAASATPTTAPHLSPSRGCPYRNAIERERHERATTSCRNCSKESTASSAAGATTSRTCRSTSTTARRSSAPSPTRCAAFRAGEVVAYGELAALAGHPRAGRAVGTFCAAQPLLPADSVPPRRRVGRDRLVRVARRLVQAPAAAPRGACRSLRTSATSSRRSHLSAAAAGSRRSRRSSTRPAACTSAGAARSRCTSISRARPWRAAPSRSCASSASTRRSARTAGARSTGRRATSCTWPATSGRPPTLVEAGVLNARHAPLERPPRRVVGRRCCRGAYLRGALLGGGSLSGPRSPHLELRTATLEGARVPPGGRGRR